MAWLWAARRARRYFALHLGDIYSADYNDTFACVVLTWGKKCESGVKGGNFTYGPSFGFEVAL